MHLRISCLAFIIIVLASSCGGNKKLVDLGPIPTRTDSVLVQSLEDRNVEFDWYASRAGAKVKSPQENVSGTVYLRMKKDSMIWMVFRKFKAEASRILIRPDSFFIIYRLEQKYEQGSIAELEQAFNIDFDFSLAQQLLVGNSIVPDPGTITTSLEENIYRVSGTLDFMNLVYYINGYDLSLEQLSYTDNQERTASAEYGDYRDLEGIGKIPYLRNYTLPVDGGQAQFKLDFKEISFQKPKRTTFDIPTYYEEIN